MKTKQLIYSRPKYLSALLPFIDKPLIKVILGQRRVGKSFLLLSLIDQLKKKGVLTDSNYVLINKESLEWDHIKTYTDLYEATKDYKYIFIDEIQDIDQREKAIRSLFSENNHDIYITGSNAQLLAGEIATYLSGRYVHITVYPLDYKEFLDFHNISDSVDSLYLYLRFGGMPTLVKLGLDESIRPYMNDLYDTIILKDVVKRYKIRNIGFYETLLSFIAGNTGSLFSALSISNFLAEQNISLLPGVISDYISFSNKAMFLGSLDRYDIKSKKIFERKQKHFFTDIGIRNSIVGYSTKDISKIIENAVYSNLISHGYRLFTGEFGNKEIDFVAEKGGKKIYVQVTTVMTEQSTLDREFGNLLSINDQWPKYVVSLDEQTSGTYKGIEHISLRSFLKFLSE